MNFKNLTAFFCLWGLTSGLCVQSAALQQTVIDSDRMELESRKDRSVFRFIGNVVISGTNLKARCDEMELVSLRAVSEEVAAEEGLIGQIGGIESLIAKGNVFIEQSGRTVQGGLAKIFPKQGYLEVTDKPKFTDASGAVVTGKSIKLERGNRRAIVEPADDGTRARVTLPPMEDLGVDLEKLIDSDEDEAASTDETDGSAQ